MKLSEMQRFPILHTQLLAFLAPAAGSYAGSTLSTFVLALKAYCAIHSLVWLGVDAELFRICDGAKVVPGHKRQKREPYTLDILLALKAKLAIEMPLDAAIWACMTSAFWGVARLGELTVPTLSAFNAEKHVKPSDI
jgi:putative Mn2+ efflux pump MntP